MRLATCFFVFSALAVAQLRITTLPNVPGAIQYQDYSAALSATGGTPPYTWSVVSSTGVSLPEGMSLNPATGVVSATQVNGQGGYSVTVQVTDSATPPAAATATLNFGVHSDSSYGGCQMFPPDSIFRQRIDRLPPDNVPSHQIPSSWAGYPLHPDFGQGFYPTPGGIPFMRVPANQPVSNVYLAGDGQIQTAGIYSWPFPAWPDAVVEGTSYGLDGPDHHILILQSSVNNIEGPQTGPCTLYEVYQNSSVPSSYDAGSRTWSLYGGVAYALNSNAIAASQDTLDNGANDSAGVPILPLLFRYSETPSGATHPLRITFPGPTNWFVWPATGCCTSSGPPQGLLYRLKSSVNWQAVCPANLYPQASALLQTLQQYGAYMSDHGAAGYIQGVPDDRWEDGDLACIKNFHVSDLEVADNSMLELSDISGQTRPYVAPALLPGGSVGAAYSVSLAEVGGNPATLQWQLSSGALPPGLALDSATGVIGGVVSSSAGSPFQFEITVVDTASGYSSAPQHFATAIRSSGVQLTIAKTHAGNFVQGQNGTYSLTVGNSGSAPSSGPVTVTENLPGGLSLVSMQGDGWDCSQLPACTRSDALPAGSSYLPITVTVSVANDASSPQVNSVTVAGGGSASTSTIDSTGIHAIPALTVSASHSGNFSTGQPQATYTVTVGNAVNAGTTFGLVTLTETLPGGLTLLSMSGKGWTCPSGGNKCTRGEYLGGGAAYPPITVSVSVAANAQPSVTNQVTASGGGSAPAAANDPTTILNPCNVTQSAPVSVADVRAILNQALGLTRPANDLNQDSIVNLLDAQIVLGAALGYGCPAS